ncbi:MAG: hypothetical protein WC121_10735 [Candidatus Kapaibacterium sp.]
MVAQEIALIIGIILSWLSSLAIALKHNNEKKAIENKFNNEINALKNTVSLNEGKIESNKSLIHALKADNKHAFELLEKHGRDSQEALLREIKESNKLLADLNAHIIRFEEGQKTQWKTLETHSRKIENLEQKVRKQ